LLFICQTTASVIFSLVELLFSSRFLFKANPLASLNLIDALRWQLFLQHRGAMSAEIQAVMHRHLRLVSELAGVVCAGMNVGKLTFWNIDEAAALILTRSLFELFKFSHGFC
jgi:hypothetical protein